MDSVEADMLLIQASIAEQPVTVASIEEKPVLAIDPGRFDRFFNALKAEVVPATPDLSTKKGRDAIASAAFRVAKLKTAIDKAGKDLNAEKRKEIDAVDAQRRTMWARLEGLQKEIRSPLDQWEAAEKARKERADGLMQMLKTATLLVANTPSSTIEQRIKWLEEVSLDHEVLLDQLPAARALRDEALPELQAALTAAKEAEALRAEVARLRAEAERREAEARAAAPPPEPEKPLQQPAPEAALPPSPREGGSLGVGLSLDSGRHFRVSSVTDGAMTVEPALLPQSSILRRNQARNAMMREGNITEAQADLIVQAIIDGHVPHVRIAL